MFSKRNYNFKLRTKSLRVNLFFRSGLSAGFTETLSGNGKDFIRKSKIFCIFVLNKNES
jgi:hypothetical protein